MLHHFKAYISRINNKYSLLFLNKYFFVTNMDIYSDIALYEYSGQYKINSTDKVRTNPKTIQQIKTEVQTKKPKDVYLQMNRQLTSGT
jgi:hypothetical protein